MSSASIHWSARVQSAMAPVFPCFPPRRPVGRLLVLVLVPEPGPADANAPDAALFVALELGVGPRIGLLAQPQCE